MADLASLIVAALEPAPPGKAVRLLSPVFPGVARTKDQIASFQQYWRTRVEQALSSPSKQTLVVLGDSLSQGIGATSPEHSYPHQLAETLRIDQIVNLSRSGAQIHDVVDTQLPALAAANLKAVTVVCTVGSNDLLGFPARPKRLIAGLVDALPEGTAIATIPDVGSLMAKRFNAELRSQTKSRSHRVADVADLLTSWSGIQAPDRFHPNDQGYALWVDAFTQVTGARQQS